MAIPFSLVLPMILASPKTPQNQAEWLAWTKDLSSFCGPASPKAASLEHKSLSNGRAFWISLLVQLPLGHCIL